MINLEELHNALEAHVAWKDSIDLKVGDGADDFPAEKIAVDYRCDFGKWAQSYFEWAMK